MNFFFLGTGKKLMRKKFRKERRKRKKERKGKLRNRTKSFICVASISGKIKIDKII